MVIGKREKIETHPSECIQRGWIRCPAARRQVTGLRVDGALKVCESDVSRVQEFDQRQKLRILPFPQFMVHEGLSRGNKSKR